MRLLDSVTNYMLYKGLDGLWKRGEIISNNLANVETPGYKSKNISFEQQLKDIMNTDGKSSEKIDKLSDMKFNVTQSDDETLRMDGNNVDIEKESAEMARTTLNYMYTQRMFNDNIGRLRSAISEGKK